MPTQSSETAENSAAGIVRDRSSNAVPASVLSAAADPGSRQSRPDGKTATAALLEQERLVKQSRQQLSLDALLGTWQLRFTAPKKPAFKQGQPKGDGFYIPGIVRASIAFLKDAERSTGVTIQNQLQIGFLKLRFTGPAKFLPKKNLLAFDFVRLQLMAGNLTLLNVPVRAGKEGGADFDHKPISQLPFFSFFAATSTYIAARGRGGGLALWIKTD